jgi:hypothetical protein
VQFGEGQPNTLNFRGGGETRTLSGTFDTDMRAAPRLVYRLRRPGAAREIRLVRLNDNLLHLLGAHGRLLAGNAGWSYTLNRARPTSSRNPTYRLVSDAQRASAAQTVFEGRTPCRELASRIGLQNTGCFKLKWRLTLRRDPRVPGTGTYTLERTGHRHAALQGRWDVAAAASADGPLIYRLDPHQPSPTLSFLAVDDSVLFFLDEQNMLLTGNGDFSYTLNRSAGP